MIKVFKIVAIVATSKEKLIQDTKIIEEELCRAGNNIRCRKVILTDLKMKS